MKTGKIIEKVCDLSAPRDVSEKVEEIRQYLRSRKIIDPAHVALTGEGLMFYKSEVGQKYWICPRCKTVHMQPSNGVCVNIDDFKEKTYGMFGDFDWKEFLQKEFKIDMNDI